MSGERCIRCGAEIKCWDDQCGVVHTECPECGLTHYGLPSEFRAAVAYAERTMRAAREGDRMAYAKWIHDISFGSPCERQAYSYAREDAK